MSKFRAAPQNRTLSAEQEQWINDAYDHVMRASDPADYEDGTGEEDDFHNVECCLIAAAVGMLKSDDYDKGRYLKVIHAIAFVRGLAAEYVTLRLPSS